MILEGTYTRKRDRLTYSYRAECSEWGTDVTWSARVFLVDRLIGEPGGKLVLVPVSATDLEHAVRHAVEVSIESDPALRGDSP